MDTKRKVIIDCDPGIDDMFARFCASAIWMCGGSWQWEATRDWSIPRGTPGSPQS